KRAACVDHTVGARAGAPRRGPACCDAVRATPRHPASGRQSRTARPLDPVERCGEPYSRRSGRRVAPGVREHLTATVAGGEWNASSGTGLVTKDSTLPNAQGTAPPVDASLGPRAKRRIARALRWFVREIEFRVLYLWSRLMGPPR